MNNVLSANLRPFDGQATFSCLVIRRGIVITGVGVTLGLAGALVTTRLISRFLYGINPVDPLTFVSVALILWLVAMASMVIPT